MIDGLKPYPEYKDSGLPWLSNIPRHWNVARNARLFSQRNQTGFAQLPILEVSLKTGVRVRNLQVYKQFVENESFRGFVTDMVYALTRE